MVIQVQQFASLYFNVYGKEEKVNRSEEMSDKVTTKLLFCGDITFVSLFVCTNASSRKLENRFIGDGSDI